QRLNDGRCSSRPLYRCRINEHRGRWETPPENMQHITDRSSRGRCHHADAPRKSREAPLSLEGKKPLGGQLHLQALELALQRADASLLHVLDNELIVAARLVQGDASAGQNLLTRLGREAETRVLEPEHRAAQLRIAVF